LDGSVYLGFSNTGLINKITTSGTLVTKVGTTLSRGGVASMTFIGNDLYLAEATQVTVLLGASPSLTAGTAIQVGGPFTRKDTPPLQVPAPLSLSADQANRVLYIGNSGSLYSFPLNTFVQTVVANSGNTGTTTIPFGAITAVGFIPTSVSGTFPPSLFAGDDSGTGRIWQLQ
jgi:hypothetical protein